MVHNHTITTIIIAITHVHIIIIMMMTHVVNIVMTGVDVRLVNMVLTVLVDRSTHLALFIHNCHP